MVVPGHERPPVNFTPGCLGQGRQGNQHIRQQGPGQFFRQELHEADSVGIGIDIGGQPLLSGRVFFQDHGSLADAGKTREYLFDFIGFDAGAFVFDLEIDTPGKDQVPVRQPHPLVPCLVHPSLGGLERGRGKRILDKPFGGLLRVVQIPGGHLDTGNADLSFFSGCNRTAPRIQDKDVQVGHWFANGGDIGFRNPVRDRIQGGAHRGFRRAVPVDEAQVRMLVFDLVKQVGRNGRYPGEQAFQAFGEHRGPGQVPCHERRYVSGSDLVVFHPLNKGLGIEPDHVIRDEQGGPGYQGGPDFIHGHVEIQGRPQGAAVFGTDGLQPVERCQQIRQCLVGNGNPFGDSGRTGCVDDVGRGQRITWGAGPGRSFWVMNGSCTLIREFPLKGFPAGPQDFDGHGQFRAEPVHQIRQRDHLDRVDAVNHLPDSFSRVVDIQRHIGSPGLENSQDGNHEPDSRRHVNGHPVFRYILAGEQFPCQAVRLPVQALKRNGLSALYHGGVFRILSGHGGKLGVET